MGVLRHVASGQTISIAAEAIVGSSPLCSVRTDDAQVSSVHALIRWRGHGWQIKDLASTNGTFVDGRRLTTGQWAPIVSGCTIGASSTQPIWVLEEACTPTAQAIPLLSSQVISMEEGQIALPSPESPDVVIFQDGLGRWIQESEGRLEVIEDGAVVERSGQRWWIQLPHAEASTLPEWTLRPSLATALFRFKVSWDGEEVRVEVEVDGTLHLMEPRAHYSTLLMIARRRLEDACNGVPPEAAGWMTTDDLLREFPAAERSNARGRINLHIFKARQDVHRLGLEGAPEIVQRRQMPELLRFGGANIEIQDADGTRRTP